MKYKVITVLGPTAIGKSDLAVNISLFLKEKFGIKSEIISADSRQVYKYLDIGTGKITTDEMKGVKHHMLDVIAPDQKYGVYDYASDANKIIDELLKNNIVPIICGGTGQYIDALLFDNQGAKAQPNPELRNKLEAQDIEILQNTIIELSKEKNIDISKVDIKNKRRVIRAIEIIQELGYIPERNYNNKYDNLIIGLNTDYDILRERINKRLVNRINDGMIEEVENLLKNETVTHDRLQTLGLEYKFISDYLTDHLTKEDFIEKLYFAICHYAKRQKTWFKNDKNLNSEENHINWFDILDEEYSEKILKEVELFITPSGNNTTGQ